MRVLFSTRHLDSIAHSHGSAEAPREEERDGGRMRKRMMPRDEGQSCSSLSGDKSFPNATIAISHSPSLSDYTDHYANAAVCVGVYVEGGMVVGGWVRVIV